MYMKMLMGTTIHCGDVLNKEWSKDEEEFLHLHLQHLAVVFIQSNLHLQSEQ